eukprot:TRINITY_DN2144_c0_g1_i1.p2 TRINITY_DN2144_c0_g1~~TRINITY_DN2144_c0_g1_i1.p2  ORF type:complete len:304 (-),score=29.68 TRINITY_DN2144_c0_g1_i1:2229-3140(-)
MPSIYREVHSKEMEKCTQKLDYGEGICAIRKETFMLHKSGYILPVVLKIVDSPHIMNGYAFIASVVVPKEDKDYSTAYLLLNPEKTITGITSNCVNHLGITLDILGQDIEKVIENFSALSESKEREFDLSTNDAAVLCKYEKVVSQYKSFLGYKVRLKVKQNNISHPPRLEIGMRLPEQQFIYDARYNKYMLEPAGLHEEAKRLATLRNMSFESVTPSSNRNRSLKKEPTKAKGYYEHVRGHLISAGIDPNSLDLWQKVFKFSLVIQIVREQAKLCGRRGAIPNRQRRPVFAGKQHESVFTFR